MKYALAPVVLFAAQSSMPDPKAGDSPEGCAKDGLYLISIRGTGEQPGIGIGGSVIGTRVQKQIEGTKIVALDYPATMVEPTYEESLGNGTKALGELIRKHVKDCPQDKMAILGYSQGAHVASDIICGGGDEVFANTEAIERDNVENHIVAVALLGDPTSVGNATYNKGTSKSDGIFVRNNTESCLKYEGLISSWCDEGDVFCAGGEDFAIHGKYFTRYRDDVVDFIVHKAKGKSSGHASNTTKTTGVKASSSGAPSPILPIGVTARPVVGSGSATAGPRVTTGVALSAANGLSVVSGALYVALPLALAAMFQML
ncbi:hypothetical protein E4U41_003886 [Claviceps citrina]|nr:hypothetical protein E4U41_003886 [Claviceps citrina]